MSTTPHNPIDPYFPFTEYRENQREILYKAKESLLQGTEVVIIEGPTGFGKSPVSTLIKSKEKRFSR